MYNGIGKIVVGIVGMLFFTACTIAQPAIQDKDSAYVKVITERAAKIAAPLNLNPLKSKNVTTIIVIQYHTLNGIHEQYKEMLAAQKAATVTKEEMTVATKQLEANRDSLLTKQHTAYLNELSTLITPDQVEQVKNGMTYNLINVTYNAYTDMIPSLKEEEKKKIYGWLAEARELAMDAESSDKKHAVFGKFKGRINNYLSAKGYDSQKERAAWEARIKAKKDAVKSSN